LKLGSFIKYLKSGYSLNYYFILQTDSSGGKNHKEVNNTFQERYPFGLVFLTYDCHKRAKHLKI
jgi:hypothetical protein